MPITATNVLRVFILNVGQADTTIVVMPSGEVMVIDAVKPAKTVNLLHALGLNKGEEIAQLVLTHPHFDHYSGAGRLLKDFSIREISIAPFEHFLGTAGYRALVDQMERQKIRPQQIYGRTKSEFSARGGNVRIDWVGPSGATLEMLNNAKKLNPNHLSVMVRISYQGVAILLAADAQMENWQYFDQEGLLKEKCFFLKAAHHGSRHGTQIERLEQLDPAHVIVSSDPQGRDQLPDLVGAASFLDYSHRHVVSMTADTGTVGLSIAANGTANVVRFGDTVPQELIDLGQGTPLVGASNPTDWKNWVQRRLNDHT